MAVTVVGALAGNQINEFVRSKPGYCMANVRTRTHLAVTATDYIGNWMAPHPVKLLASYFVPDDAVVGDNTDTTFLNVVDVGIAAGTTELSSLELLTGFDLTANAKNDLSAGVGYATELQAGDVLALQAEKSNAGVLIPAGNWIIVYQNN